MKLHHLFLVVASSAVLVMAQNDTATTTPSTAEGVGTPGFCLADSTLLAATSADPGGDEDEDDEDGNDNGSASEVFISPKFRCEDGPQRKIHTIPGEFHWPPIYRGTCDNLECYTPPCRARKIVWRRRCVLVYKYVYGWWKRIGYRSRYYIDHLKCSCTNCNDIKSHKRCTATRPCPNSHNPKSFCYWKYTVPHRKSTPSQTYQPHQKYDSYQKGQKYDSYKKGQSYGQYQSHQKYDSYQKGQKYDSYQKGQRYPPSSYTSYGQVQNGSCECCTSFYCKLPKVFNKRTCSCVCPVIKCPYSRIFNPKTCGCDCPRGTTEFNKKCVGDCDYLDLKTCPHVNCEDNRHLRCEVRHYKCVCPSCKDNTVAATCTATKCLEQPSKPKCMFDDYSKKCRCPNCYDQKTRSYCEKTYCGYGNNLQCKYRDVGNRCLCPNQDYKQHNSYDNKQHNPYDNKQHNPYDNKQHNSYDNKQQNSYDNKQHNSYDNKQHNPYDNKQHNPYDTKQPNTYDQQTSYNKNTLYKKYQG